MTNNMPAHAPAPSEGPSRPVLSSPPVPTVWASVGFTDVDAGVRSLTEGLGTYRGA